MKPFMVSCVVVLTLLIARPSPAGRPEQPVPPVLVEKGATVTATVDEEDFDGLTATTEAGVTYAIWTPPDVDFQRLAAFHREYKKKPVTFRGDVYKDERGLSIAVESLPGAGR